MKRAFDIQRCIQAKEKTEGVQQPEIGAGDIASQFAVYPGGIATRHPADDIGCTCRTGESGVIAGIDIEIPEAVKEIGAFLLSETGRNRDVFSDGVQGGGGPQGAVCGDPAGLRSRVK